MPIQAEDSIIADSTLSTSPPRETAASPPIKRAARIYGRKRDPEPQRDASFSTSGSASPPPSSYLRTAPPNLRERVPATSDNEDNDSGSDSNASAGSRRFGILGNWKEGLADIDKAFDDEAMSQTPLETSSEVAAPPPTETSFGFGQSSLLDDNDTTQSSPARVDDIFGNGSDRSTPNRGQSVSAGSHHEGNVRHKRTAGGRSIIHDSDSEGEAPRTSPLSNSSPSAGTAVTAVSRPHSETPPTSDNGMTSLKSRRRSKGRSVPPLDLEEVKDEQRKKSRTTKLTKKEQEEVIKNTARLAMDRKPSVQRLQRNLDRYSVRSFMSEISGAAPPKDTNDLPSEDAIHAFSSPEREAPPLTLSPRPPKLRTPSPDPTPTAGPSRIVEDDFAPSSDSDDDDALLKTLKENREKREAEKRNNNLARMKAEILKRPAPPRHDSDDDDLEIVDEKKASAAVQKLEKAHAKTAKPMTHARKTAMQLAGIRPSKVQGSKAQAGAKAISRQEHDQQLWGKVEKNALDITKQREEEWTSFGGHLREEELVAEDPQDALRKLAAKGLQVAEARDERRARLQADDDDDSDDDYIPEERGSMSPQRSPTERDDDEDVAMADGEDEVTDGGDDDEGADSENEVQPRRRRGPVIESDEENDENAPIRPRVSRARVSRTLSDDEDMENTPARRSPSTSTGYPTENEDKENQAVVRFRSQSFDLDPVLSLDLNSPRRPLQVIPSQDETPKALDIGRTSLTELFGARLSGPQRTPDGTPGPSFRPLLGNDRSKDEDGFSQFSAGEPTLLGKSSSHGDLSDLFDATTQRLKDNTFSFSPESSGGLLGAAFIEKPFSQTPSRGPVAREDSLDLTQDVQVAPRPLQVQQTQARKADALFEKDQELLVLGEAFPAEADSDKLYVNEEGFLTQTRPNVEDPEIYEPPSPTQLKRQHQSMQLTTPLLEGMLQKTPLSSMTNDDDAELDTPAPLRRLRKRSASPSDRAHAANAEVQPKRSLYDVLRGGPQDADRKKRRKLDAREFVVGEAEESDDEGRGWSLNRKPANDGEEDDDEDMDKPVENLVNDEAMDDETLAEHLVREKHKEAEAEADRRAEEEAHAIIEGRRRKRRRNGDLMSEGSEDEEDGDRNRRARERAAKAARKREDVEALENNPLTKAFADIYKSTTEDDNAEFSHLAEDHTQSVLDQLAVKANGDEEEEEEEEEEDDEETQERAMDISEFSRTIRERIQNHRNGHRSDDDDDDEMDPRDTSWLDAEEEDQDTRVAVKTIKSVVRNNRGSRRALDPSMEDVEDGNLMSANQGDERYHRQGQSWAKREGRNRNAATARSVGAAAVTGLTRAKTGGGSLRQKGGAAATSGAEKPRPVVKKAESILISKLGDKSSKFST